MILTSPVVKKIAFCTTSSKGAGLKTGHYNGSDLGRVGTGAGNFFYRGG